MSDWRTDNPPESGYYLAAWWRGKWTVSELWYTSDYGWRASRGYFPPRFSSSVWRPGAQPIPVKAWMPLPEYVAEHPDRLPEEEGM